MSELSESSYIGAYWGSRVESAGACGERLAQCFADFAAIDPVLGSWFLRGMSKASAKTPVGLDASSLAAEFNRGRNRADFGGAVIEELGVSIGLWNRARPAVGLTVSAGAYPSVPGILNCFVLKLSALDEESAGLYSPEAGERIFKAVVDAWGPDWATWTTTRLNESQSRAHREPVVGWLTYLREKRVQAWSSVVLEPFGEGTLIKAASDFADVDEATVRDVRQHLQQQSAIQPIPFP